MRLALATWSRRRAGGVETYVEHVLAALHRAGHDVALWFEEDVPSDASPIVLPPRAASVSLRASLDAALAWRPDGLIVNGLRDVALETRLLAAHPTLYVAHNFGGTCISGTKTWSAPIERPCARRFGPGCLAHYFPHRCGGLSPVTMVALYGRERRRLAALAGARRIVTLSEFMRTEYLRHGFEESRVVCVPYGGDRTATLPVEAPREIRGALVFVGRLERLKGVHVLLDALPSIAARAGRSVSLTVLGDGPERVRLEEQARRIMSADTRIAVQFEGRVTPEVRDLRVANADLLVVPSLWPEPFGLVGLEAARLGVPAAAFDVGGIRQWLTPGDSGVLAPGDPPTPDGLADAIVSVLTHPTRRHQLSIGAVARARAAATPADHAAGLLTLLGTGNGTH